MRGADADDQRETEKTAQSELNYLKRRAKKNKA